MYRPVDDCKVRSALNGSNSHVYWFLPGNEKRHETGVSPYAMAANLRGPRGLAVQAILTLQYREHYEMHSHNDCRFYADGR